jgi:hypothetical protein
MLFGVSEIITLQGRQLTPTDIAFVRQLIADHPRWSRRRLSIALCEAWNWRNANDNLKDMACRSLLVKLHERAHIQLPPRRQIPTCRMAKRPVADVAHDTTPVGGSLAALQPLRVIDVRPGHGDAPVFQCLLSRYHYLGYTSAVGENMKYLVVDRNGRALACLLFGSSAWSCSSRDDYIGWDREARRRHIQYTTNNTRFLIVPWVRVAHLASHVLALICRRIAHDWYTRYGHALYLLETYVDQTRFTGTCYRAANWQRIGETRGRSRNDRNHRLKVAVKSVFVYPLSANFQQRLTS